MDLPFAYALFEYWQEWPPTHIAMKLAWFEKSTSGDNGMLQQEEGANSDVVGIMSAPGIVGNWIGPPPFTPADVIRLAEEAKAQHA